MWVQPLLARLLDSTRYPWPNSRKETAMIIATPQLMELIRDESGQDLIEYGLILAVMALALIASMTKLTNTIYNFFTNNVGGAF
jgi:Flp pilus assembly pilin Flp